MFTLDAIRMQRHEAAVAAEVRNIQREQVFDAVHEHSGGESRVIHLNS
jgi:hypothetical protein